MPTIRLAFAGDNPSSVQLTALTRSDTGLAPIGFTLPASFTLANGVWSFSQPDVASPPTSYSFTYKINWPDGTSTFESGAIAGGRYYTQGGIEAIYGQNNVAIWSNKEGNSTTADPVAIAAAGTYAENYVDSRLRASGYVAPLLNTSADFAVWTDIVNELAGVRLYMGRGEIQNADTADLAGQMEKHRLNAMNELRRLLTSGIDAVRASSPAVTVYDPRPQAAADGYAVPQVTRWPYIRGW